MPRVPVMSVANDARAIAHQLIPEHHPHLGEADILYVFTDQKRKRCDRVRLGSAAKMNSLQRFLASGLDGVEQGPNFIILIDSVLWGELDNNARHALVDHELSHYGMFVREHAEKHPEWRRFDPRLDTLPIDEEAYEWRWGMYGHDIEEFALVLARWGWWKPDGPEREVGKVIALQLAMPTESNGKAARKKEPATV